ncbi:MAG: hypothetical protein R6W78_01215 [Bacteroidales bacterium]
MESILKEHSNIEKHIRKTNLVVWLLFGIVCIIIISFSVFFYRLSVFYSSNQLILEHDGSVRKVGVISENEAREIEIKDHLARFIDNFYSFDQNTIDKNINASLWLGGDCIKNLYFKYKNNNWYNKVIQLNIIQEAVPDYDQFKVDISTYPYKASASAVLYLKQGNATEKFQLNISCTLENVSRNFPNNPHGLFITELSEQPLKSMK